MGLPRPLSMAWTLRPGVKISRVQCGGIACERLQPRNAAEMTLLYIHGGGYVSCSPQTHRPNTVTLTRLLNADTYVPDYRLAPEHPFPAGLDDVTSVYEELCRSTGKRRIVVAGDSAGGGMAIAVAIRARDRGLPAPASILTFSPWVDMTPGREPSLREREHLCDMFYAESIAAYADAYLQGADPHNPLASPVVATLADLPPLLIEVSDTELLYPEAVRLQERWAAAGNAVELNASAGLPHGWQEVTPFVPEARDSLQRAVAFARRH
jgi:acetyl esterase/lipase